MPGTLEALLRRVIPSVPVLTRNAMVGKLLDVSDRIVSAPYPEYRPLPPNRFRVRVGVGNRLLFNQAAFLQQGASSWLGILAERWADNASDILDIGSGCGRFAHALKLYGFDGFYTGIDVDAEMVSWCETNFPSEGFAFIHANRYSAVYNPGGQRGPYHLPIPGASQDLVMSQSLFTHLLQHDLEQYVHESFRVLRPDGVMVMSVFCLEHLAKLNTPPGRWSLKHRLGESHVESVALPEAAVGYEEVFLECVCRHAGFSEIELRDRGPSPHSFLIGRKVEAGGRRAAG
jgi:SAM-dependent methyltransferase